MATRHEDGNAGRLSDTIVRPKLDIREQNDLALDRRQACERGEQSRAEVSAFQVADGGVAWRSGDRFIERNEPPAADRARAIERPAMDDGEEPGGESGWLPARGQLVVRMHEGLLRDVVRLGGVAKDGEGASEGSAAMPAHQRRERVLDSRQRTVDQLLVAQLGRHVMNRTPEPRQT